MLWLLLIVPCLVVRVSGYYDLYEGDECKADGHLGNCTLIEDCRNAGMWPTVCSYSGGSAVVCCTYKRNRVKSTTTSTKKPTIMIKHHRDVCPDLDPTITKPRNGQKSWDKCIEYQEKYVYPCEKSQALFSEMIRQNRCHHHITALVVGGVDAAEAEFPHMVLLGYDDVSSAEPKWQAGGTIISNNFILTAAHCTFSKDYGEVKYIRAGVLTRSSLYSIDQMSSVIKIVKHPLYKSPNKYHDIALLKTRLKMALSSTMVPACLDVNRGVKYDSALVTGWGQTKSGRQDAAADTLQKVTLDEFSEEQCRTWYPRRRFLMDKGYQHRTQMCYGERGETERGSDRKDACQGDSGGPIQVRNSELNCMYTVIGITSSGKGCGEGPGIYTRVSYYVPWIEKEVWPDEPKAE